MHMTGIQPVGIVMAVKTDEHLAATDDDGFDGVQGFLDTVIFAEPSRAARTSLHCCLLAILMTAATANLHEYTVL